MNATVRLLKGHVPAKPVVAPLALRSASVLLFLGAVVLGWLAFTRFDGDDPPPVGSPGFREYEAEQIRDSQLSAGLGLATAFALLGAFACWHRAAPHPPEP